jgi:hypothetical protein
MAESRKKQEISQLYLDLASECFSKAAIAEHADAAEQLRRMGRRYMSQAAVFDASLGIVDATPSG